MLKIKNLKLNKKFFFLILIPIISIGFIYSFSKFLTPEKRVPEKKKTIEQVLVEISQKEMNLKRFFAQNSDYQQEIKILTPIKIIKLAEKYPAIYEDLPKKFLHQVKYWSANRGYLVIIDIETGEILKLFRLADITIF